MRAARTVRRGEEGWPRALDLLRDVPEFLRVRGELPRDGDRAVSVVGSRTASPEGLETARRIGAALARAGVWVVSGGARGVDAAAHAGAIEAGGRTLVVVGGGLDHLYPAENRGLFARAVEAGGGIASEWDDGTPPAAWSFPRRNRIVAALGEATVVVRAGRRSGALLTAGVAARLGLPVRVPEGVAGAEGEGMRALLDEGAAGFADVAGLLAGLGLGALRGGGPAVDRPGPGLRGEAAALWGALGPEPRGADEVGRRTGMGPGAVLAGLAELELIGLVDRRPGRGFARRVGVGQGE
jgi:DNA processing protein